MKLKETTNKLNGEAPLKETMIVSSFARTTPVCLFTIRKRHVLVIIIQITPTSSDLLY